MLIITILSVEVYMKRKTRFSRLSSMTFWISILSKVKVS